MDRRLQLIAHLYEEEVEGLEPLDTLLEDPELRREYRALRESRFALDHRDRFRPEAAIIDAIVAKAAPLPTRDRPWTDRPALRLVRSRRILVPAMAVAAVLLVAVSIYPLLPSGPVATSPQVASKSGAEPEPAAESLLRSLPPAPPAGLATADLVADPTSREADDALPAWDNGRDLRQLSRRIAELRAAGVDAWDDPAVPLEMMPTESGPERLLPADARRPRQ